MMRMQREYTQMQLAEKSGVSTPIIRGIENGTANFTIDNFVKVATALDCIIDISLTPSN